MSLRLFLLGLPTLAIAATWWAAQAAHKSRVARANDLVALLSVSEIPRLHPFAPSSEAERQLNGLLHAPLISIGEDGRLQPSLAAEWHWSKRVTVWFATADESIAAQSKLNLQAAAQRSAWKLSGTSVSGRALQLTFDDPLATHGRDVLRAAAARVLPVTILRINAPAQARAAHLAFLARSDFAALEQRVWFDHDDAFELALVSVPENALPTIQAHLTASLPVGTNVTLHVQARNPTLDEPVLEFRLREGARWPDGSTVGAQDVIATVGAVMNSPALLRTRASLRLARTVEANASDRVQAIYWRHHGPAIGAWLEMPILPATWLREHAIDEAGHVFESSPPPGAGPYRLERYDFRSLVIRSTINDEDAVNRLTLLTNFSSFSMQLGYKTHALDFFWPNAPSNIGALQRETLLPKTSPPHDLVTVVFNTRRTPFDDARLRSSLALATDRVALASQLPDHALPHSSIFMPGLWLSSQPACPSADLLAAEHMLSAGGWLRNVNNIATRPDGALVIHLLVPADNPALHAIAVPLAEQWRKLGAQVTIHLAAHDSFASSLETHEFDVALVEHRPAPTWDLTEQWHSASTSNLTGYHDRQIDLLLEALSHEFDPDEAAVRSRQLEALILNSHAVLPLLSLRDQALVREGLSPGSNHKAPWTLRDLLLK